MSFFARIKAFNEMYRMPEVKIGPDNDPLTRLQNFLSILQEEIEEGDEIFQKMEGNEEGIEYFKDDNGGDVGDEEGFLRVKTEVADWLGDIIVFCASEAKRWNIPIEDVLTIIMDSNASKLGADGKPIYDERGKVLKGPNYWRPEPKIRELLLRVKS